MEKETEQKDELEMISGAVTSGVSIMSPLEKNDSIPGCFEIVAWKVGTVPLIDSHRSSVGMFRVATEAEHSGR